MLTKTALLNEPGKANVPHTRPTAPPKAVRLPVRNKPSTKGQWPPRQFQEKPLTNQVHAWDANRPHSNGSTLCYPSKNHLVRGHCRAMMTASDRNLRLNPIALPLLSADLPGTLLTPPNVTPLLNMELALRPSTSAVT